MKNRILTTLLATTLLTLTSNSHAIVPPPAYLPAPPIAPPAYLAEEAALVQRRQAAMKQALAEQAEQDAAAAPLLAKLNEQYSSWLSDIKSKHSGRLVLPAVVGAKEDFNKALIKRQEAWKKTLKQLPFEKQHQWLQEHAFFARQALEVSLAQVNLQEIILDALNQGQVEMMDTPAAM